PLVFVSLGTVASDRPDFYRAALDALGSRGWRAVVATGRTDPDALGPIPANVIAAPYVPQLAVLGEADVFVSHGGMNSTMESLTLGVPLVIVPQLADQFQNAEQVQALGLGRAIISGNPTAGELLEAIDAVLGDPAIRQNLRAMQAEIDAAGGVIAAANAVEALLRD
ncbi:MAG: nucleotide disphospho-sugar-binding domain-containing protein, partial [Thermomicrobiales bacterium]